MILDMARNSDRDFVTLLSTFRAHG